MKKWLGPILILSLAAGAGKAQPQQKSSAQIVPTGKPQYLYIVNRNDFATGGNGTVGIWNDNDPTRTSAPSFIAYVADPGNSFLTPYDIVADPARRLLYVSNSNASPGTVSVISADSLSVVDVITISDGKSLRGMSMSDDGASLFVAGQSQSQNTAAVFRIDLSARTWSLAGFGGNPGDIAEDCAVVPTGAAGGAGNAPGRVYYSVPGTPGSVRVIDFVGTAPPSLALTNTQDPGRMDRSNDGKTVFVACSPISGNNAYILQIDPGSNSLSEIVIGSGIKTWDVSFRSDDSTRAYALVQFSGYSVLELQAPGAAVLGAGAPNTGTLTNPGTVRHLNDGTGNDTLYFGSETTDPINDVYFARNDATSPSLSQISDGAGSAPKDVGAFAFALMPPPPPPQIFEVCPKAGDHGSNIQITVHGAGFFDTSVILLPGAPLTLIPTFINSGTLQATIPAASYGPNTSLDVTVRNLDGQQALLRNIYTTLDPTVTRSFTLTLPSLAQGYQMLSVPLFVTVTDLRKALEVSFGPYNPVYYRVFFWVVDHYVELDQMIDDCDLAGRAFWAISRFGGSATLTGIDCWPPLFATGFPLVVPLNPGWNLISMPFTDGTNRHMNWDTGNPLSFNVVSDGATWAGYPAQPAAGTPALLNPTLFDFTGGVYVSSNLPGLGQGYFVHNETPNTIYLLIDSNSLVLKAGSVSGSSSGTSPLAAGSVLPPPPPASIGESSGSRKRGCGLVGAELLLLALGRFAFHRLRALRTLRA